ncbi:unnamed protein product [Aspergillus oryzae]|uniref:Unnamed protein product n=1 Tax=Aspergillus oryzae TaxID=5062 RepID=A0AAN5BZK7_ASPOZ|nr:unnamed protein product [Aspergillus oryzae]GMG31662.1 unnamed protein product [Aspergillus oryzae]
METLTDRERDSHGHNDRREIGKDTQSSIGEIEHRSVHTMTSFGRIPRFVNGLATKNIGQNAGHTVSCGNEHDQPNGAVEIATGKNAHVEDQDGNFSKTSPGAVDNRGDNV